MNTHEVVPVLIACLFVALGVLVFLAISGLISYLVIDSLKQVPPEHRKIEPAMIWLLMIPCFQFIWAFFVFQRVPESFQSYFNAQGRTDVGDCGKTIGLWLAICGVGFLIPWVNIPTGIAALVLLILSLVRYNELKKKITSPGLSAPPAPPPAVRG